MKIAVVAANGKAGQLIVEEAVKRGHDVTAIVRSENKTQAQHLLKKDLFDLNKEDLAGYDVVVTAFGAWTSETLPLHSKSIEHFNDLLAGTNTRFLVVGGAGSLYVDKEKKVRLVDTAEFPAEYKPLASAQADELDLLRTKKDLNWTFVSPAAEFIPDGARTGEYILAGDFFTVNEAGESKISYADYAIAFVDEIESGKHIQERISVLGK
ncbi:NAD(P)-dependent oxidoreductase [Streptococcus anginosus]|uniref:NAD(P)-dependent oxidoreductase n=1 Tax=Streptococcus anginosus TaxID=1328 RepID=UPI00066CAF61|nr:NAD(P)-dependent oxidoreductase [Streptococcus anginosus]MBX9076160.1 NAD(P)-dependent oxidoreductase [Streptococcus anginosus]VTY22820.1 NADH(P)-binding protein [Streptococcus anginosus]